MSRWTGALVLALLAAHAALLWDSIHRNFVVVDEAGHVASGLSHWQTGTFWAYRVNPPLPRMLAALPMAAAGVQSDYTLLRDRPGYRPEWRLGSAFADINGARYFPLVCLARLVGIGWSLLGGLLVFAWTRDLYGSPADLLALTLWCLEPTVLAFAGVVVPDVPAAVAGLAANYVYWRYLREPSWRGAWYAGLLLGVAELTKFTWLVLFAVWPLLWLVHALVAERGQRFASPFGLGALRQAFIALVALMAINTGYAFDGTCRPLGDVPFVSRSLAGEPPDSQKVFTQGGFGNRFRGAVLGRMPVPLPADYLRGIDQQRRDFEQENWLSYLCGEWRRRGWWYYYLYAMAVKLPVGSLILMVCSMALTFTRPFRRVAECSLWLPVLAVFVLISSQTGFNHHMRYVLPVFPYLFISAGKMAATFFRPGMWPGAGIILVLLTWSAGSVAAIHPHYMSYFNEAAGGPDGGPDHLVDSNVDWGQDLLFLKTWLEEHPQSEPLQLAYYNIVDPRLVGISFSLPARDPRPGFFAVDVNFVKGSPFAAPDGEGHLIAVPAGAYSYFQRFRPIAKAGYSIYLYRISLEEANALRRERGLPLLPAGRQPAKVEP